MIMKKITLLAAAALMFNAAHAFETTNVTDARTHAEYSFDEPIAFIERGIEFFVFPNGEFDFNTEPVAGSDTYYRNGRRTTLNTTHGAPGSFNGGVRIDHDAMGRVRRIGNVFINYDQANRIKRIGSVYMSYNREMLTQVGGLRIVYDRRGRIVDMLGNVNGNGQYAYNDAYYGPAEGNHYGDNYYYKNGTKTGGAVKR